MAIVPSAPLFRVRPLDVSNPARRFCWIFWRHIQFNEHNEGMNRPFIGSAQKQVANAGSNRRHVEFAPQLTLTRFGFDGHFKAALLMLTDELSVLLAPI